VSAAGFGAGLNHPFHFARILYPCHCSHLMPLTQRSEQHGSLAVRQGGHVLLIIREG